MNHTVLKLVCAGAFLCLKPALGQFPGNPPPGTGPTTPSTFPGGPSQSPGGNNYPRGTAPPNAPDTTAFKVNDQRFAQDAAINSMSEVELGKLALQKGSSDDIKQFGQKMVDEHTKTTERLKEVTQKEGIRIADALDTKHQSRIEKLSKLSGEDFDKAYIKDQLKADESRVRDYRDEAQGGANPNVKAFASSTLPVLQQQLDLAKKLNKSAGKAKGQ